MVPDDGLSVPPGAVQVRAVGLRLPGETAYAPTRGRVLLQCRPGTVLSYGDLVDVEGVFADPGAPLFPGAFDYAYYLKTRGIRHTMRASSVQFGGSASGWRRGMRWLYAWRNRMAAAMTAGVSPEGNAAVLLAMTFGFRQQLPPAVRRDFLRSGAIHIFAVSGLHVGIVALVFGTMFTLTRIPYGLRRTLLPFCLGVYVVMTGASASAIRAWMMISLVQISYRRHRCLNPINVVAAVAVCLLLVNPLSLFQSGFIFSFTIVTVLVLGWPLVSRVCAVVSERDLWLPRRYRRRWLQRGVRGVTRALGASALAWFGSAGLVLYTNGLVVPAALVVNLVLSVLACGTLTTAVLKLVLGMLHVPLLDALVGWFLSILLECIHVLVSVGSSVPASFSVPRPSLWQVVLYYGLLGAVLLLRGRPRLRLALAGGMAAWLLILCLAPGRQPVTAIVSGDDSELPIVVVEMPRGLPPLMINSGSSAAHRDIAAWLQHRGHRTVEALVLPWDASKSGRSALLSATLLDINAFVAPARSLSKGSVGAAVDTLFRQGTQVRGLKPSRNGTPSRVMSGAFVIEVEQGTGDRDLTVHAALPEQTVELNVRAATGGQWVVTVRRDDGPPEAVTLKASLRRQFHLLPKPP